MLVCIYSDNKNYMNCRTTRTNKNTKIFKIGTAILYSYYSMLYKYN